MDEKHDILIEEDDNELEMQNLKLNQKPTNFEANLEDIRLSIDEISKIKLIDDSPPKCECVMNKKKILDSEIKYYTSSCFLCPKLGEYICSDCLNTCHKGHQGNLKVLTEKSVFITDVYCSCAENLHKVNRFYDDNEKNILGKENQCGINEVLYYSNVDNYLMDPNSHMYYCLFCYINCIESEEKNFFIKIDRKKFSMGPPSCACSNKKNHDSISENIKCLETFLKDKKCNININLNQIPGNIMNKNILLDKYLKPIKDIHYTLYDNYEKLIISKKDNLDMLSKTYNNSINLFREFAEIYKYENIVLNNPYIEKSFNFDYIFAIFPKITLKMPNSLKEDGFLIKMKLNSMFFYRIFNIEPILKLKKLYDPNSDVENVNPIHRLIIKLHFSELINKLKVDKDKFCFLINNIYETILRYDENLLNYQINEEELVDLICEYLEWLNILAQLRFTQIDEVENIYKGIVIDNFKKTMEIACKKKINQNKIKECSEFFVKVTLININDEIFYREVLCNEENKRKIDDNKEDKNENKNESSTSFKKNSSKKYVSGFTSSKEKFIELEEEIDNVPDKIKEENSLKNAYIDYNFSFTFGETQLSIIKTLFSFKKEKNDNSEEFKRWEIYDWLITEDKDFYLENLINFYKCNQNLFSINELNNLMIPLDKINIDNICQNSKILEDIKNNMQSIQNLRNNYFDSSIDSFYFIENSTKNIKKLKENINNLFQIYKNNCNIYLVQLYLFKIGIFDLLFSMYNTLIKNSFMCIHLDIELIKSMFREIFDLFYLIIKDNMLLISIFFTRKSIELFLGKSNEFVEEESELNLKISELKFYLKLLKSCKINSFNLNFIEFNKKILDLYELNKKIITNKLEKKESYIQYLNYLILIIKCLIKVCKLISKPSNSKSDYILLTIIMSNLKAKFYLQLWDKYKLSFNEGLIEDNLEDNENQPKPEERSFILYFFKLIYQMNDYQFYIATDEIPKFDLKALIEDKVNSMDPYDRRILSLVYSKYYVISPFNLIITLGNTSMDAMTHGADICLNGKVIATNLEELEPSNYRKKEEFIGGMFGSNNIIKKEKKKENIAGRRKSSIFIGRQNAFSFLKILRINELSLGLEPIFTNLSKYKRIMKLYINTYFKTNTPMFVKYFRDVILFPSVYSIYKIIYFTPVFSAKYKYLAYKMIYLFLECLKFFIETLMFVPVFKNSKDEKYKQLIDDMFYNEKKNQDIINVLKSMKDKLVYDVPKIGKDPKFEPLKTKQLLDYYVKYIKNIKLLFFLPLELGGKHNNPILYKEKSEEDEEDLNEIELKKKEFKEKINSFIDFYIDNKNDLDNNVMVKFFSEPTEDDDLETKNIKETIILDILFRLNYLKDKKNIYPIGKDDLYILTNCINKIYKADPDLWHDVIVEICFHTKLILKGIIKEQLPYLIQLIYIDFHKLSKETFNKENLPISMKNFLILLEYLRLHCENHHKIFQTILTNENIIKINSMGKPDRLDLLNFILKIPIIAMNSVNFCQSKHNFITLYRENNYDYFNDLLIGVTDYLIEIIQGSFESNMKRFALEAFKSKNDKDKNKKKENNLAATKNLGNQFYENSDFDNYIDVGYLCFDNMENEESEFFLSQFFRFIICFFEECLNPTSNKEKIVKKFNPKKLLLGLSHSTSNLFLHYKENKKLTKDYVLPENFSDELIDYYLTEDDIQENYFFILSSNIFRFFKMAIQWKSGDKINQYLNEIQEEIDENQPISEKNKNYNIGKREAFKFYSKIIKEVEIYYKPKENMSELERRKFKDYFDSIEDFERNEKSFRNLFEYTGNVQKVVYLIHPDSLFVHPKDMQSFNENAPFDKNEKLNYLLQYITQFQKLLQMRKNLWKKKNKTLNLLYNINYTYTTYISMFISLILNIIIFFSCFYVNSNRPIAEGLQPENNDLPINWTRKEINSKHIFVLNIIHLIYIVSICSFWIYLNNNKQKVLSGKSIDEEHNSLISNLLESEIAPLFWNLITGIIAGLSVKFHFIFSLQLFTIFAFFETMQTVIYSVRIRYMQFLSAGFLIIIFSLFFAMIKFYWFTDQANTNCLTYQQCFLSIVTDGIRGGGGMGFSIKKINEDDYFVEFLLEWIFYFSIILILLNIINGIIVDTFQALREEANAQYETKMNVCFICSLNRSIFERRGIDFDFHKEIEHNCLSYFHYLYKILQTDEQELNSLDYQVLLSYRQARTDFFPVNTSLSISQNQSN